MQGIALLLHPGVPCGEMGACHILTSTLWFRFNFRRSGLKYPDFRIVTVAPVCQVGKLLYCLAALFAYPFSVPHEFEIGMRRHTDTLQIRVEAALKSGI